MPFPPLAHILSNHSHTRSLDFCLQILENSSRYVGMVHTSSQVILCTTLLGACWEVNLVISQEAKRGRGVGPEKNQLCLAWQLPQGRSL